MELIDLLKDDVNWREKLSNKPYCLDIKEKDDYVLLKYNQIDSDMSLPLVQICRGIIIDLRNNKIVCRRFDKFFNYGEGFAAQLKGKIRVEEKTDGSIIGVWCNRDGEWTVSTNGMIDANDANLTMPYDNIRTYRDLFDDAWKNSSLSKEDMNRLNKDYTYIFELVSPLNRIVVPYANTELYFLGMRNNETGQEISPININDELLSNFKKPFIYPINSLDDAIVVAKTLGTDKEGFVLVDENFNRVKVKGTEYLAMHMIRNNDLSLKSFLATILNNSQDDLISYFPEYKPYIEDLEKRIKNFIADVDNSIANAPWDLDRKNFALSVKDSKNSDILFKIYSNKNYDWKKDKLSIENINKLSDRLGL